MGLIMGFIEMKKLQGLIFAVVVLGFVNIASAQPKPQIKTFNYTAPETKTRYSGKIDGFGKFVSLKIDGEPVYLQRAGVLVDDVNFFDNYEKIKLILLAEILDFKPLKQQLNELEKVEEKTEKIVKELKELKADYFTDKENIRNKYCKTYSELLKQIEIARDIYKNIRFDYIGRLIKDFEERRLDNEIKASKQPRVVVKVLLYTSAPNQLENARDNKNKILNDLLKQGLGYEIY